MSKRVKVEEANNSAFNIGCLAPFLFLPGFLFFIWFRDTSSRKWLNNELVELGIGDFNGYAALILLIGIPLLTCIPATLLARRSKIKSQQLRNNKIDLEKIHALYLRPYYTDSNISIPNPFYSMWSGGVSLETPALNPEEFVARVLERHLNIYAFGGNNKTVGMGRATAPNLDWQFGVTESIKKACFIVIFPYLSQLPNSNQISGLSTLWELNQVANLGKLDRTIAIMPCHYWYNRKKIRDNWEKTCEKALEFGVILPKYNNKGCMVTFEYKDELWKPLKIFGDDGIYRQKRLARGLIEALFFLSERFNIKLNEDS